MEKIESVSVTVQKRVMPEGDSPACSPCATPTGNLIPLLYEIRHALERWLRDGHTHVIDLRSLPMSPDEEQQLLDLLGEGEVSASLSALGNSEVLETAFAGVWRVAHFNDDDVLIGHFIEICHAPDILKSHPDDARMAIKELDDILSNAETTA
jgi:hydrogenase-1 operon protein HyaF